MSPDEEVPERRSSPVPWAGAIVLLAATLFILFGRGVVPALSGTVVPFELQATDIGGQMYIRWNIRADNVTGAENALFEVTDGKQQYQFPVSRAVLSAGAMEYSRKSDDVVATVVLFRNGKETERRSIRSVSAP